jgi:NTP pyrophosphatase (non-canonical NTP hydrolase)
MNDKVTKIQELKEEIRKFRDARGWEDMKNPKDAALSLVLEAAELLEHFQWKTSEDVKKERRLFGPIADELADVLWWVIVVADAMDIDVVQAFERKLIKNKEKYPAEAFANAKTQKEKDQAYYRIKAKARGSHPLAEED